MNSVYCRSTASVAEDLLVKLTERIYNVSRGEAVQCQIQRREICPKSRARADELLLRWEATTEQIAEVSDLVTLYTYELRRNK